MTDIIRKKVIEEAEIPASIVTPVVFENNYSRLFPSIKRTLRSKQKMRISFRARP